MQRSLLLLAALAALAIPSTAQAKYTNMGTHPQAAAQPTGTGKIIVQLEDFGTKVYAGFGDYLENTGPIAMNPLVGTTFAGVENNADTEAAYGFRQLGSNLYVPSTDPRVSADYAVYDGTTWSNLDKVDAAHVFDVAQLGTDLFLIGGGNDNAAKVWRSTDGGSTFTESLSVAPISGTFSRFYGGGVFGGNLYVQAHDSDGITGGAQPTSRVFNGTSWSTGPNLGTFNKARVFAGKLVFMGAFHAGWGTGPLKTYDGTTVASTGPTFIRDYDIQGSTLYALFNDDRVRTTTDLVNWTLRNRAPSLNRSIAVSSSFVFIGTGDSKLFREPL